MVPVNLRGNGSAAELGNRISLVPVTIPLDIRQPRKLLAAVHKRTEFLKGVHAAELVSLAGSLIGMFPSSMQGMTGPFISQLPITPFNMVCTNVPGPQLPLYLLGHKMLHCYPYVPVGGEMAVNCAILSYNGAVYFGFSGDVHAAPDLKKMEKLLDASFTELRDAAGIRPQQKKKVRRKTKAASAGAEPRIEPEPAPVVVPVAISFPSSESKRVPTAPATEQENVQAQLVVA
jgi:diacylglycerol O-acyltransferase